MSLKVKVGEEVGVGDTVRVGLSVGVTVALKGGELVKLGVTLGL